MDMGRGKKRVRCMERVTWEFTLPYVKQMANGNLLYGSGNSNRGSGSTWRGGMGREMGGRFKREGIYIYLDLQDLLELTHKKDALFIIGD